MSEDTRKRCPNIAWAFWHARKLNLTPRERLILMAIAERADADLSCAPTQAMLAEDTGLSPRTVNDAVNDLLLGRKGREGKRQAPSRCIEAERRREGLRYKLLRPINAHAKPLEWPEMPLEAELTVADPVLQNLHIQPEVVTHPEPQNLHIPTPETAEFATPDMQNLRLPLMKSPLKDSPVRTSLRDVERASAPATQLVVASTNVVALPDRVEDARSAWNEVCTPLGFPACREMPDARRRNLQRLLATRFAEPGSWRAFCVLIASSEFLASGHFGIDWVIKPANLVKIVEGNYRGGRTVLRQSGLSLIRERGNLPRMRPTIDEPDRRMVP
jgi:hypothetical protein